MPCNRWKVTSGYKPRFFKSSAICTMSVASENPRESIYRHHSVRQVWMLEKYSPSVICLPETKHNFNSWVPRAFLGSDFFAFYLHTSPIFSNKIMRLLKFHSWLFFLGNDVVHILQTSNLPKLPSKMHQSS